MKNKKTNQYSYSAFNKYLIKKYMEAYMKANKFIISGFNKPDQIADIEQKIRNRGGINAVRFDMQADTVTVDYDEGRYSEGDIKNFVTDTGLIVISVK